jgi:hypothetical protein
VRILQNKPLADPENTLIFPFSRASGRALAHRPTGADALRTSVFGAPERSPTGFAFLPERRASHVSEELRPIVVDIDDPRTVEDVAGGSKSRWNARGKPKIKERPKSQEHVPAFVSNG